jgi:arylsulfatase A-like enzyme/Tfp pilus assembly protein PilF
VKDKTATQEGKEGFLRCTFPHLLVLGSFALLFGCRSTKLEFPQAPIVLISIDTLRADRLPAYGWKGVETPVFDRLARDGIVFENAYSHYPLTLPSHTSVLSGLLPPEHGVRDNSGYRFAAEKHPFLPRKLQDAGYATGAFVSAFVLRKDTGLSAGFDRYEDSIHLEPGASLDSGQRPGKETVSLALSWLDSVAERPFFLFLHLYEPHAPYTPPLPFAERYRQDPYSGEVAAADAALRPLLEWLDQKGKYDSSIIVLLGDHGEGLGDHGEQQHGVFLYRSTLHVPLIVKLPGKQRAGERVRQPVGLVDVAPTLAQLVGVDFGQTPHALSLFSLKRPQQEDRSVYAETYYPRIHYGWSDLKAVYEPRFALIQAPDPELFDLASDPHQKHNVLNEHRREFARLSEQIRAIDRPLADPEKVDAETAARLAALGYLTVASVRREEKLPDPKSQRHLLADIEAGFERFSAGDFRASIEHFRKVLAVNDRMSDVWAFLARAHHQLGQEEESVHAWERVLELSGGNADAALLVGAGQLRLGNLERARALAAIAARENPSGAEELFVEIELRSGNRPQALARLEALERSGKLGPTTAQRLALFRLEGGKPVAAIELLQPFRTKGDRNLLVLLALALSETGRNEEALAVLEEARARPGSPEAKLHEAAGTVLLRLERFQEARNELEQAIALDPKRVNAWNSLGVALYQLEGPRAALAAWQRALSLNPDRVDILWNVGLTAAQIGESATARAALQRFLARAPEPHYSPERQRARGILQGLGRG